VKISVVVPCFNHAGLVARKYAAIQRQTIPAHEIIFVDDGSTDNSWEEISKLPVRGIRLPQNAGVPTALNRGIEAATGDYLFLTALDDDILDDSLFFKAGCQFHTYPNAGFWTGLSAWMDMASGAGWVAGDMGKDPGFITPHEVGQRMRAGTFVAQGNTCVWRRAAFTPYNPSHRWQHDWFVMHAIAVRHGVLYRPDVVAQFNIRRGSYCTAGRKTLLHEKALENLITSVVFDRKLLAAVGDGRCLMDFGLPMWDAAGRLGMKQFRSFGNWVAAAKASARGLAQHTPPWLVRFLVRRLMSR